MATASNGACSEGRSSLDLACRGADARSLLVLGHEIVREMATALAKDVAAVMMSLHYVDTSIGPRFLVELDF